MIFAAPTKHDEAMQEMERKVDLSMLQVIRVSRQLSKRLNDGGDEVIDVLAKRLKEALAECDRLRLEWLEEYRKSASWKQA